MWSFSRSLSHACFVLLLLAGCSSGKVSSVDGPAKGPKHGALHVEITGLPPGTQAVVKVRGSDGFEKELQESTTFEGLPPVAYVVEAEVVRLDGHPFYPSVLGSPVHLDPKTLTTVHVRYASHPFFIKAPSLVLPLTSEGTLEIEVLRFQEFADEVTLEILDPLPRGILASPRTQIVPENRDRTSFTLLGNDQVEALEAPLWLRIRASSGSMSSEHFVEFRVAALVTSPGDTGPGSLREVLRAATVVSDAPRVRFSRAAFSAPTEIRLATELEISSTVDLEGPLSDGGPLVTLAPTRGGRGLVAVKGGEVRLASLRLERGTSTGDGGCLQNGGTLLVEGVIAEGCRARRGGAIANTGQLEIRGGTFTANVAEAEGGGIFSIGELTISQLALAGNSAEKGGGLAVGASASGADLVGGTFTANQAAEGGALWADGPVTISLRSTVMTENRAQGDGGAIRLQGDVTLLVQSSQLLDNGASRGGAVYVDEAGIAHLQQVNLEANEAEEGGAVHNAGMMTLVSVNLLGNSALAGSGGAIVNTGNLTLEGGRLEANAADGDGGAILHESPIPLVVIGSEFVENTAARKGGALQIEKEASVIIEDSSFLRSFSADGGAIMADGSLSISDSIFEDNESFILPGTQWLTGAGGAIRSEGTLSVRTSQFRGNRCYSAGGAIAPGLHSTIDESLFEGNEAGSYGGAVFQTDVGALIVTNSAFLSNHAGRSGEALENRGLTEIFNSTFYGNSPNDHGYAIDTGQGTTRLFHTTVVGNGRGIYVSGLVEIFASIFADNAGLDIHLSAFPDRRTLTSLGYNLVEVARPDVTPFLDSTDQWGTVSEPLDPQLYSLSDNGGPTPTMMPLPSSPARKRIPRETCRRSNEGWTWRVVYHRRDQRGVSRPPGPWEDFCSIGAVESF